MADTFDAMMRDIGQDYQAALRHVETDAAGRRHWRDVVFAHVMGFRPLTLFVSVPPGAAPPPLVVFMHGGAWKLGHPMVTNPVYAKLDIPGSLLAAGFAVARISYRFSSEAIFPAQLHDCKAAVRFMRNHADVFGVDPDRFAAMGDSAGGHLAALVGLTGGRADLAGDVGETAGSSAVQGVIDWFGPADFLTMAQQAIAGGLRQQDDAASPESQLIGGPVQQRRAAARAAAPMSYVTGDAPPFLIQHGRLDRLVPIEQSRQLHAALRAAAADSTLIEIEGADHCFWGVDASGVMAEVTAFLDRIFSAKRR